MLRTALFAGAMAIGINASAFAETLTWVTRSSFVDWDPAATYSEETYILGNVYETLTFYENGEVKPRLAASWEKQNGGKVWVVNLREGVTFHDGTAMNATAVRKSFEFTKSEGRGAAFVWSGLSEIEVLGDLQLKFTFSEPTAFDLRASGQYGAYIIAPAAVDKGHDWMQQGNAIGTGPYRLAKVDPGQRILLEKFDAYWGGWQAGSFERAIVQIVTEASTRVQMLQSGAADIGVIPPDQIASLDENDKTRVSMGDSWRNQMFLLNFRKYPTDNLKFRQALTHLFDYESVRRDILAGTGTAPRGPLPASMWGAGKFELPKFDPQKAAQLLEESGVPRKDWKVTAMYIGDFQPYAQSIELFQAHAAEVGVEVTLLPGEWGVIWGKAKNPDTAANIQSMTWWPAYATPSDWLWAQWHTEKKPLFNLSYYSNPKFDAATEAFLQLEGVSREAAAAKSIEAQSVLIADVPAIFYADIKRFYAHSTTLKGVEHQFNPAYETLWINKLSR